MTEKTLESRILVDWLQFTFKDFIEPAQAREYLGINNIDFVELNKGGLGYKKQAIGENIRIFWDGNAGMGVHLQISGQGCRTLESRDINLWSLLFYMAQDERVNITRLDIAVDLDYKILHKFIKNITDGRYISKNRQIKVYNSVQDKQLKAETLYLGSRQSKCLIRVYDKAVEQGLTDGTIWERIEIQLKADYIKNYVPMLQLSIPSAVSSLLFAYFRPLKKVEKNITRSEVEKYYLNILEDIKKISLFCKAEKKTIEDKFNWVSTQVAPTVALLNRAFGNDVWLKALAEESKHRIKEQDLKLVEEFKKNECSLSERKFM